MLRSWSQAPDKVSDLKQVLTESLPHLHDDQAHAAQADGGLESGHGLGVGQPVKTRLVHLQQQIAFLEQ